MMITGIKKIPKRYQKSVGNKFNLNNLLAGLTKRKKTGSPKISQPKTLLKNLNLKRLTGFLQA